MPKPKTIFLVRHAQAEHNRTLDYSIPDPALSPLGETQAANTISPQLPPQPKPDVIITSPFRRTLQTSLLAFGSTDIPIIAHPLFQECASKPCDTGSPLPDLLALFPTDRVEWEAVRQLGDAWHHKTNMFASDDQSLKARAAAARDYLADRPEQTIAVVTHGAFLQYLLQMIRPFDNAEVVRCDLDEETHALIPVAGKGEKVNGMDETCRDELKEVQDRTIKQG
ncbi:hypothetical protein HK104_008926 [Borealophlyctis nickersoniae]|nr:hypothetical protein HK104_008926 [Borealophlyctis nickersoniae]